MLEEISGVITQELRLLHFPFEVGKIKGLRASSTSNEQTVDEVTIGFNGIDLKLLLPLGLVNIRNPLPYQVKVGLLGIPSRLR